MDLVELLERSVQTAPPGDHSVGLNAIVRHVKAAIRHLERDKELDPDTCTDAIYRMNQAYEGSLKEAYRVLAGKDPAKLTPFEIEEYLENNNVVRPRVLTQLTRYRKDYRNPSTHDYKLDFDEDEALLAIVSVCAFAKLLINQIDSKLASQAAQARAVSRTGRSSSASLRSLGKTIAKVCLAYTNESQGVGWFEYDPGIAQSLVAAGFQAEFSARTGRYPAWNTVVKKGRSHFGIQTKVSRPEGELQDARSVVLGVSNRNCSGGLLILRTMLGKDVEYHLYGSKVSGRPLYVILEDDDDQLERLSLDLGELKRLS